MLILLLIILILTLLFPSAMRAIFVFILAGLWALGYSIVLLLGYIPVYLHKGFDRLMNGRRVKIK